MYSPYSSNGRYGRIHEQQDTAYPESPGPAYGFQRPVEHTRTRTNSDFENPFDNSNATPIELGSFSPETSRFNPQSSLLKNPSIAESAKSRPFSTSTKKSAVNPKVWPTKPRRLRPLSVGSVILGIIDVIGAVAPVLFLALAIVAKKLDGQPILDEHGQMTTLGRRAIQASTLGPTIFPILFAAIAGTALKMVARLLAERGAKLGVLETLVTSRTLFGVVQNQFLMNHVTLIGCLLLVLWAFSPLGGQASLRILAFDYRLDNSTTPVVYMPTGPQGWPAENFTKLDVTTENIMPITYPLYGSTMAAPMKIKTSSQDEWFNVKIPRQEVVMNSTADSQGWRNVPSYPLAVQDYATLSGIPMGRFPLGQNTTSVFSIEYSYTDLNCTNRTFFPPGDQRWADMVGFPYDNSFVGLNASTVFQGSGNAELNRTSFWVTFDSRQFDKKDFGKNIFATPRTLIFGSEIAAHADTPNEMEEGYDGVVVRNCTMQQVYLEAMVNCTADNCAVRAMRPSLQFAKEDPNVVLYHFFGYFFSTMFPSVLNPLSQVNATQDLFLRGADMPFNTQESLESLPLMWSVDDETFSKRLGVSINTYAQIRTSPYPLIQGVPPPNDQQWANGSSSIWPSSVSEDPGRPARWTTANTTTTVAIFACQPAWFGVLLVSSLVLLSLSVANALLKLTITAPDVMGYVSSLTYDNPFVPLPPGGSVLDAPERSRALYDLRVRIGDVQPESEVGRIAFAAADNEGGVVGKLRRERLYY
ncbi:hypothetical protein K461DRAFT_263645 [Myriangium duriaei CBS 260.36]|uniref:Uncharacterized protein n=1 Tax=Myriangium duriaei CBS 260.36 TaxID=1168546 RepID=A0A9P4MKU1_9PEZI|nr:hypothetical protein K461DRAFT_263645 [Myriangium duriaei CBS 260.36]